ncbi:MAG: GNAT family N-acetyltransferase [Alphaproteobacteria bacterium]|nr:GNAT family N-acetyltransferase [Alphaproteobacteria bacterium]
MASTDPVAIAPLAAADAAAAAPLSVEAGWNQVEADWNFMLGAGHGFGVRGAAGGCDASALVLQLGPAIAWVSMVLVHGPRRRQGLGTALLHRCFDLCAARGWLAALDATELGRPLYLPLGFRDVFALRRWRLERAIAAQPAPAGVGIAAANAADVPELARFDAAHTALERPAVLAHLLPRGPAFVARGRDGAIVGSAFARAGRVAMQLGPILATDPAVAASLAAAQTAASAGPWILDVPFDQAGFARLIEAHGGASPRGFMRMTRGEPGRLADARAIHAIAGPELA